MKYDPKFIMQMEGELGRVLRCVYMASGCLTPLSKNKDERLAWFRLYDALNGEEPRGNP